MKCDQIQDNIADLFDDQLSENERTKLLAHLRDCENCQAFYTGINHLASALKEEAKIPSGAETSQAILSAIEKEESMVPFPKAIRILPKRIVRIAASVLVFVSVSVAVIYLITFRTPAFAAGKIIGHSILAISRLQSVCLMFGVRTSASENFETIDPAAGFLDFTIYRVFTPETKWRFEKPGRTVIMDGKNQFLVNESGGYILKGNPGAGFVGWMRMFLDPMKVLEAERSYARDHHSDYKVREIGKQIEVSIVVLPQGDYSNPYALNATIPDSKTRRVYLFDRETNMLRSLMVYLVAGQEETCVVKLTMVQENEQIPDSIFGLSNRNRRPVITSEDWDQALGKGLKDIGSGEAARIFFTACGKQDWKTVERFSPLFSIPGGRALKVVRNRFSGSLLLQIGRSFTSGTFAGEYVPYTILNKEGDTITGNLAIRNDNPFHSWVVDGGY